MSLIKIVKKEEATGSVAAIYGMMEERVNFIPNVVKLYSGSPEFMEKFLGLTGYYTDHPVLDSTYVAYTRLLISHGESCEYCVRLQTAVLSKFGVAMEDIIAAKNDYIQIKLETKRKELICFVLDMMFNKLNNKQERLDKLRELGWTDQNILDATMLGAIQKGAVQAIKGFKVEFDF